MRKISSREMKDYKKFTYSSNTMEIHSVCRDFGLGYIKDQSANRKRKRPKEVEFGIRFNEDQDVHWTRQTMKVSLKILKLYCCESWGCILRRSSDTPSYMRRKF